MSDALLVLFFFIVSVELKHELTVGELSSWKRALAPALAAVCGVAGPAVVYLVVTGGGDVARGWPIPTATDIAFALGVLALFGRGLPARVRAFLLALAVIDDLIGIVIIAVFFAGELLWWPLLVVAAAVLLFRALAIRRWRLKRAQIALLIVVAVLCWYFTLRSGVHATIAGVLLGAAMPRAQGARLAARLKPWSDGFVLPLFAFAAALVLVPSASALGAGPVFLGVALALPLGKVIGITFGGSLAALLTRDREHAVTGWDLIALAMTGGVGFTVALLMNQLAQSTTMLRDEGVLGVLAGSGVSVAFAALLLQWRAARYRRRQGA